MSTSTPIDLSQLPAPEVVETLEFEEILAAMLADLRARDATFDALVESDPAYKILEVAAWRETILRQRVNDAARAVMLASATGGDLDQLGALLGVTRNVLDPGDPEALPPVAATYETDADFRRRIQLSLEGFSTAGPAGAYVFHALTVADVLDVAVSSPNPGEVVVTLLSRTGDGTAPAGTIADVEAVLNDEDVRPLTDQVTVQGATIVSFDLTATLYTQAGPDPAVVLAAAEAALVAYTASAQRIGKTIPLSALYAALHVAGVARVVLTAPAANVAIAADEAAFLDTVTLTHGGIE